MNSHEFLTLVNDVEFRLEMGKAVGSELPLPGGVLQRLVSNPEFQRLHEETRLSSAAAPAASDHSSATTLSNGRQLYQTLAADDRVKLLLLESIARYNHQISVVAGFRSYLETTASKLWNHVSSLDANAGKPNSSDSKISLFSARRHINPILNLALAALLGTGSIVPPVLLYNNITEHRTNTPPNHSKDSKNPQNGDPTQNPTDEQNRIDEAVAKRIKEITDLAGTLAPKEIKISDDRCSRCSNSPSVLSGTLSLQLPKETPELKVTMAGPSISLFPQPLGKNSPVPTDYNLNLHLFGIPETKPFPSALTLNSSQTPNYRVETLPASFVVVDPTAKSSGSARAGSQQANNPASSIVASGGTTDTAKKGATFAIKVVFPISYQAATTCDLKISVDKGRRVLNGNVEACNHGMPPQIVSKTFTTPPIHDSSWHFVPEVGAMVKIEEHRAGFLGLGSRLYDVSIQAVPFSNLESGTSEAASKPVPSNASNQ